MLCFKFGWNWPMVLEKKIFLISSMYFPYFVIISPWKRAWALHLNKLESPSPKDALCQVWLKSAHWFWRRRWKCEKFRDGQTDRQTMDDRWSEKLTWAFSSGELKTKLFICTFCFHQSTCHQYFTGWTMLINEWSRVSVGNFKQLWVLSTFTVTPIMLLTHVL